MFFKKFFFMQAHNLIKMGRSRIIQIEDRLDLPTELSPTQIPWAEDKVDWSTAKSLLFSVARVAKKNLRRAILFQVIGSVFAFATPFLLHAFIKNLEFGLLDSHHLTTLIWIALGFGFCGAGNGIAIQHYFYETLKFNQIATNLVNKKIFSHALQLSNTAKARYQVGDIVNYMSSDSDAIADASITTIDLSNAVVLLLGCTATLFYYLGWSAAVAVVVMLVLVPITHHLSKSFMHLEDRMMSFRDQRMTLMTQVLNAIRVVKYFVWEKSVLAEVEKVREKEIKARYDLAQAEIFWGLIYTSISSIVLFTALLTHVLRGYAIDLALIFTCISVFSIMEDHFGGLSRFISRFINILVSAERITKFVRSETVEQTLLHIEAPHIAVQDLSFNYPQQKPLLQHLNLNILNGSSLAVVGPVGGGKTTFLQLFLGEHNPTEGRLLFSDSIRTKAFVPQDAYIINASLRENILFGQMASEEKIQRALYLSALEQDLKSWPSGLDTEIGEKGVNLSGGQKQRVSLARAILAESDLFLLDDPLSAVDPNTENWLIEKLIFSEWKNKTRIVVTHRLSSLAKFNQILFLENGLHYVGTYEQLMQTCEPFRNFLKTQHENEIKEAEEAYQLSKPLVSESKKSTVTAVNSQVDVSALRITEDEDRAIGAVDKSVYMQYLKALGGSGPHQSKILILLFVAAISVVAAPMLQKIWLSQSKNLSQLQPLHIVLVYGILGFVTMLITYLGNSFWSRRGIAAGRSYHDRMLKAVLAAPIRFFDSTPIGRVLQRFSRDVESVDIHLQWSFDHTIHSVFNVTMSFLLIVFVLPIVIIFMIPIFYFYYRIQNDYRRVAREVKRLDSTSRSPRYAHFKEVLQGLTVIRAFDKKEWAMSQFYEKLNNSTAMFHTHYMVNRWFSSKLPLVGAAISTSTALMIIFSSRMGWIAAGTAGLITLYAIDFWRHLNWGVRIFSDLESRMTSVERLQFYTQIAPEIDLAIQRGAPVVSPEWPTSGDLEFRNVHLRYAAHLPLVLKNVSFKIKSGSRVGLIGRTGSGKSTIFQSVYRFVDIEQGQILFDQREIDTIPLQRLRQNLSVIPQDPTLFMGTLRGNIDRYSQASDEEIMSVLKKVSLDKFVMNLPNQLLFQVAENGSNLSQGQRQLICLARALLMKVKIIFLDEATASVDVETDAIVQKVIRESLKGITLVTIAHRLSTLEGYDAIIELSQGEVVRNTDLS